MPAGFTLAQGPPSRPYVPAVGPQHFKTFRITAPLKTHWRAATCDEVRCDAYRFGWVTTIDLGTDRGQRQAYLIKTDKTRSFSIQRVTERLVKVLYGPGQKCFAFDTHYVRVGRLGNYLVDGGDWRGNPRRERRVHKSGRDWAEDCAEHCDKINTAFGRG